MPKNDNIPVLYLELVEQSDSGFILDGTERTPYEQRLTVPEIRWIPTEGNMIEVDDKGVKRVKRIRHIANCESIDPEDQVKRGLLPNRLGADKIPFRNGRAEIRREGSTIGLYDYLKSATYNADNPLRPSTATPLYREVKAAEVARAVVDNDELITTAKTLVYGLRVKDGKGGVKFAEDRIDMFCRLLGVGGQTMDQKVEALLVSAMTKPEDFIATVTKSEQRINTEIGHGIELKVIAFDDKVVHYSGDDNRVIVALKGKLQTDEEKISKLADWFGTPEGKQAYDDFKIKLDVANEQKLSS